VASFELVPPHAAEFERRLAAAHVWLVAEDDGVIAGYAYGSPHKERAAYRWSADVAIYISASHHGRGLGRRLYEELFPLLEAKGIRTLCAGITLPNDASVALHERLGFEEVGTYRNIGWKQGAWWDVVWLQRDLRPGDDSPPADA
jgi:phosphinothricin acetyltransferase